MNKSSENVLSSGTIGMGREKVEAFQNAGKRTHGCQQLEQTGNGKRLSMWTIYWGCASHSFSISKNVAELARPVVLGDWPTQSLMPHPVYVSLWPTSPGPTSFTTNTAEGQVRRSKGKTQEAGVTHSMREGAPGLDFFFFSPKLICQ